MTLRTLLELNLGESATVAHFSSQLVRDIELVTQLRALGLCEGARVLLIRRAPWLGPLHVRIDDSIELAVARAIAGELTVAKDPS